MIGREPRRSYRADACAGFAFAGVGIDSEASQAGEGDRRITAPGASVEILVVHTEEEWAIALACRDVLTGPTPPAPPPG